jgi:carbonic anhydrase
VAIVANVRAVMAELAAIPILAGRVAEGSLKIVGGEYDLATGAVDLAG